jgi:hypothetical protein
MNDLTHTDPAVTDQEKSLAHKVLVKILAQGFDRAAARVRLKMARSIYCVLTLKLR